VVQTIATADAARGFQGIALDANYLYIASPAQLSVTRANLDGSNLILDFTAVFLDFPERIAIDARYIYITQPSNDYSDRFDIDGTNLIEGYIGGDSPIGIAVDAKWIYFANQAEGTIGRAAIDASSIDYGFITGCSYPNGLAMDGQYLYWANQGSSSVSTPHRSIGRANIDGTGVNQDLIPSVPFAPTDVAVNDRHIYFLRADDPGGISRAALDGSSVQFGFLAVPTIRSRPNGIASNDTAIYWTVDDAIQMVLR
jgi:virginiamycin B lyase